MSPPHHPLYWSAQLKVKEFWTLNFSVLLWDLSHLCLCHLLKGVVVLINVPHHISFNFTGYTHFPGLGQVSHNKWFVFRQLLISDWTFDDWIFMLFCQRLDFFKVSHVKVWILRTLTTMSGSVLSSGLDLSCLLVSWTKQIFGHLAVSWTRKQATHPQLSWEKAWEQQQFLEIEKAVLRYWCQSPPCLSKSESAAAVLFILKSWDNLFLGWKL